MPEISENPTLVEAQNTPKIDSAVKEVMEKYGEDPTVLMLVSAMGTGTVVGAQQIVDSIDRAGADFLESYERSEYASGVIAKIGREKTAPIVSYPGVTGLKTLFQNEVFMPELSDESRAVVVGEMDRVSNKAIGEYLRLSESDPLCRQIIKTLAEIYTNGEVGERQVSASWLEKEVLYGQMMAEARRLNPDLANTGSGSLNRNVDNRKARTRADDLTKTEKQKSNGDVIEESKDIILQGRKQVLNDYLSNGYFIDLPLPPVDDKSYWRHATPEDYRDIQIVEVFPNNPDSRKAVEGVLKIIYKGEEMADYHLDDGFFIADLENVDWSFDNFTSFTDRMFEDDVSREFVMRQQARSLWLDMLATAVQNKSDNMLPVFPESEVADRVMRGFKVGLTKEIKLRDSLSPLTTRSAAEPLASYVFWRDALEGRNIGLDGEAAKRKKYGKGVGAWWKQMSEAPKKIHDIYNGISSLFDSETGPDMTSMEKIMEGIAQPNGIMYGNPLVVTEYPALALCPNESLSSGDFVDYEELMSEKKLATKVWVVASESVQIGEVDGLVVGRLGIPQWAPVSEITVFKTDEKGVKKIIDPSEYKLEYLPDRGYYRIVAVGEFLKNAGEVGYTVGLDSMDSQVSVPEKIDGLPIDKNKLPEVYRILEESGLSMIVDKIKNKVGNGGGNRFLNFIRGKKDKDITSADISAAIGEVLEYGFGDGKTKSLIAETTKEDMFGFLPKVDEKTAKIIVQCRHNALLNNVIVNMLLADTVDGKMYESSLMPDVLGFGIGLRVFSIHHADSRIEAVVDGKRVRSVTDITPDGLSGLVNHLWTNGVMNKQSRSELVAKLSEIGSRAKGEVVDYKEIWKEVVLSRPEEEFVGEMKSRVADLALDAGRVKKEDLVRGSQMNESTLKNLVLEAADRNGYMAVNNPVAALLRVLDCVEKIGVSGVVGDVQLKNAVILILSETEKAGDYEQYKTDDKEKAVKKSPGGDVFWGVRHDQTSGIAAILKEYVQGRS